MSKILSIFTVTLLFSCGGKNSLPVGSYYHYDQALPLNDSTVQLTHPDGRSQYMVTLNSVHDKRVTGLLDLPEEKALPCPVVILVHGVGDRKTVDYIEAGVPYFLDAGYAVMRIDVSNHGPRKVRDFDYSFTGDTKYRSREVITQTVFDLQRTVDFLETRPEIDSERIGYYGISLGGIIGTVFSAIDQRVGAVVLALAGGGLHFMYGMKALTDEVQDYLSIIDPINFVADISPRPLLMINAENDEVVPPVMSKLLFREAGEPKSIIWYPSRHRSLPIDKAYPDGVEWFDRYLTK